jgi:hypothetical protein
MSRVAYVIWIIDEPMQVQQDNETTDSRLQRIGTQTKGLIDDLKSWVELRMELTQIDVEERVEDKVSEAMAGAALVALGALTALFLLIAAAFGLGELLGHPGYGFLVVGGVLLVVTLIIRQVRPRLVRINRNRSRR